MKKVVMNNTDAIENKIYTVRGQQIMFDRDLAALYQTNTRTLKQSVKRNKKIPTDFMFELNENDIQSLVSQTVIPSKSVLGGAFPFAFTEQGVAMLASVIKSETAVRISISIIRAFVAMRKSIATTGNLIQRVEGVERKLLQTDQKVEQIFSALEKKEQLPAQGVFFNGQIFYAYKLVADIIRKAKHTIILIDNYVDDNTLQILTKKKTGVLVTIYTHKITRQLELDAEKFNQQYGKLEIKKLNHNHDRFLILDQKEMYHIGASLKDLGTKIFGFSKMDAQTITLLSKLKG
jgi:hypothetical protein